MHPFHRPDPDSDAEEHQRQGRSGGHEAGQVCGLSGTIVPKSGTTRWVR
jgi:hypothetical protein